MGLDLSKLTSELGDEAIAKAGEPFGLDRDQSVRVAKALAKHFKGDKDEAVQKAAAETGLTEEVVASLCGKLVEMGGERLLEDSPVGGMIAGAGGDAAKGMLGKLFGRKSA